MMERDEIEQKGAADKKAANKSPIIRITSAHSMESNRSNTRRSSSQEHSSGSQVEQQKQSQASNSAADNISLNQMAAGPQKKLENMRVEVLETSTAGSCQTKAIKLAGDGEATHAYKRRWLMLAIFCAHSAINSFQWIQYSSITNIVSSYYQVTNLAVNLTSLVYMITYIPFIIHASLMLEAIGLRCAICLGAAGTAAGSLLKLALGGAPTQLAFWGMMAGQTVVALSQLYIISIPPLLAAIWFPDHQVSTATGIGVFGNQLGIALGFIVPPALISSSSSSGSAAATTAINGTEVYDAAQKESIGSQLYALESGVCLVSLVIFVVACVCLKDRPPKPPGSASLHAENQSKHLTSEQQLDGSTANHKLCVTTNDHHNQNETSLSSITELVRDRDFKLLMLSYGINVGCFYAVSTVLNQMVAKKWPNPDDLAGTMGLLIVVSGMAGSVMCGQILDRTHAYKLTIVLIYLMSLVSMLLFTLVLRLLTGPWPLYVVSATLGFFMTGYLPLGFEFAAEITYPHPANTPAGLLNLAAQVFGLLLTYSSSLIVDKDNGDLWANMFLTCCLAAGLILTIIMKADLKRQKAVAEEEQINHFVG